MTVHQKRLNFRRKVHQPNDPSQGSSQVTNDNCREASSSIDASHENSPEQNDASPGPLGLNIVFTPKHVQKADIVFVHGLGGASRKTWSKNGDPELFWPQKFLPLEPHICLSRILTFGYNANIGRTGNASTLILDFAKELLFDLRYAKDNRKEDLKIGEVSENIAKGYLSEFLSNYNKVPLIFVAHSMGGLIVKEVKTLLTIVLEEMKYANESQAYMQGQNDPEYEGIVKAIAAITFLATPHRGTNLAEVLNRILLATLVTSSKQYIYELCKQSSTLRKLNEQFRHIAPRLDITSFYETQPTPIVSKGTSVMIVEKDSSILGYPRETSRALDADHHTVCKYDNPQDPNYVAVRNKLQSIIIKAISTNNPREDSQTTGNKLLSLKSSLCITEMPDIDYNFFRDQWSQGTCGWLLNNEDYVEWLQPSTFGSSFFWIVGAPGAGKSVLSSFIINDLVQRRVCCQYFFISFGDSRKRSLTILLRSIAYQLALIRPDLLDHILQLKDQGVEMETAGIRKTWDYIFKAFVLKMEGDEPTYWVIDGLDEADNPRAVVKLFCEITESSIPIRIIFISRETPEIATSFRKVPPELCLKSLRLEGHKEDLACYIEQEFSLPGDDELRDDISEKIVTQSRSNFLWVRFAVDTLNSCHSKKDMELALRQLPIGMQPFYDRMALSIAQKTVHAHKTLATAILGSVATTLHVLTVTEISQTLEEDTSKMLDFQRLIVDVCCGFVVIDRDGYVSLVHHTAREYLLSDIDRPFQVDRTIAHKQMFLSCMRCLMAVGLRSKLIHNRTPVFLNYAASSWPVHLVSTSANDIEVMKVLNEFLSGRWVLIWMQFLATTDQLGILIQASQHLSRHFGKQRGNNLCSEHKQTTVETPEIFGKWAEDFAKINGKFGQILRLDPESIHELVPPFCPQNSAIYQQFGRLKDEHLIVSGLSGRDWNDLLARLSYGPTCWATSISAVGTQIATLVDPEAVFLHEPFNFEETIASPIRNGERVRHMVLNSKGTLLATYGWRTVKIWQTQTGDCKLSVDTSPLQDQPLTMAFSKNDRSLLIGSGDKRIRSLNLSPESATWHTVAELNEPDIEARELKGHFLNSPNHMALDQNGKLASVAYRYYQLSAFEVDGSVHLGHCWHSGDVLAKGRVRQAIWHPRKPELLGLYSEGVIFRWRPYDNETTQLTVWASQLAMSTDGSLVVTGDARGSVKVFTTAKLTFLYQVASEDPVRGLSFSPDLRRFYDLRTGYGNVWEPKALLNFEDQQKRDSEVGSKIGTLVRNSDHPKGGYFWAVDSITCLAASPKGCLYCFGTERGVVFLYDQHREKITKINQFQSIQGISHMIWSPDGQYICFLEDTKCIVIQRTDTDTLDYDVLAGASAASIVKLSSDSPITQLLFHPASIEVMVSSSSLMQVVSVATASVTASTKIGIGRSRWTIHPQKPTLIIGVRPHEIRILDWSLSLHHIFKVEPSIGNLGWLALVPKANVVAVLPTVNEQNILVQIECNNERFFCLIDLKPIFTEVAEKACANNGKIPTSIKPIRFQCPFSSQILLALDILPSSHLIFLSKDFSICSVRLPSQQELLQPSSSGQNSQAASESNAQDAPTSSAKSLEASRGLKASQMDKPKLLFWLPRDWKSEERLALCQIWRKERSLLYPVGREVAVVRCAALA